VIAGLRRGLAGGEGGIETAVAGEESEKGVPSTIVTLCAVACSVVKLPSASKGLTRDS
jgi:hypothetical protein